MSKVTNLVRALKQCQTEGMIVVGLDADGDVSLHDLEASTEPMVIVVGSEGRGLSRLVGETCDLRVSIPMAVEAESLNASVAAAVTLARSRAPPGYFSLTKSVHEWTLGVHSCTEVRVGEASCPVRSPVSGWNTWSSP